MDVPYHSEPFEQSSMAGVIWAGTVGSSPIQISRQNEGEGRARWSRTGTGPPTVKCDMSDWAMQDPGLERSLATQRIGVTTTHRKLVNGRRNTCRRKALTLIDAICPTPAIRDRQWHTGNCDCSVICHKARQKRSSALPGLPSFFFLQNHRCEWHRYGLGKCRLSDLPPSWVLPVRAYVLGLGRSGFCVVGWKLCSLGKTSDNGDKAARHVGASEVNTNLVDTPFCWPRLHISQYSGSATAPLESSSPDALAALIGSTPADIHAQWEIPFPHTVYLKLVGFHRSLLTSSTPWSGASWPSIAMLLYISPGSPSSFSF